MVRLYGAMGLIKLIQFKYIYFNLSKSFIFDLQSYIVFPIRSKRDTCLVYISLFLEHGTKLKFLEVY